MFQTLGEVKRKDLSVVRSMTEAYGFHPDCLGRESDAVKPSFRRARSSLDLYSRFDIQYLANLARESVPREGLLKKESAHIQDSLSGNGMVGIAGHQKHP